MTVKLRAEIGMTAKNGPAPDESEELCLRMLHLISQNIKEGKITTPTAIRFDTIADGYDARMLALLDAEWVTA